MCFLWQEADKSKEASLANIADIADTLRALGVMSISISGGEPLERSDLPEIIEIFKKRALRIRLLTNGINWEESKINDLIRLGVEEVSISLHSLDPEKQDYICNRQGAWQEIVSNMDFFLKAFKKKKSFLLMNTVVSGLNIGELPDLADFAMKKGLYISFIPLESERITDDKILITKKDRACVEKNYGRLLEYKKKRNNILNSTAFLNMSKKYFLHGQINNDCDAGKLYFSVSPEGGISICHKLEKVKQFSAGDFNGYFNSAEYSSGCRELIKNCKGCIRPCWRELSFWAHDLRSFSEVIRLKAGI